eukprot:CAMPEP_0180667706 /NCGR_PEP_ID=MMETSP1037_2-20121125/62525_1 /TAXON_ID=632150 /ORGANISM="Azadinium spinosum, Strain 3D9" /LENGTH=62 /DNA_ID=CAMNT_0022696367 /DNA_START=4 /DNA_END=189 /DNA_ORIENTATION=-
MRRSSQEQRQHVVQLGLALVSAAALSSAFLPHTLGFAGPSSSGCQHLPVVGPVRQLSGNHFR